MKKAIRPIALALLTLFSVQFLTGCFGKFALTRKLYEANGTIGGKDMTGKFLRSVVLWVLLIIPVYQVVAFIDFIILNLIEFWTGSNIISMKEGQSETQLITYAGREFQLTGTKGKMTIVELSGANKGKETVLYFDDSNSISVLHNGNKVKVAEYMASENNFAMEQNTLTEKAN